MSTDRRQGATEVKEPNVEKYGITPFFIDLNDEQTSLPFEIDERVSIGLW